VFDSTLSSEPYQVVARLLYGSARHVRLEEVVGFVVNLRWIRAPYFPEITSEMQHVSGTYEGLGVAVQDRAGDPPDDLPLRRWTVRVSAAESPAGSSRCTSTRGWTYRSTSPSIAADRTALDLVLDNVVDNALRYSTDDRRIAIRAAGRGRLVEVAVADNGIGIPADEPHLVELRFVRGRHAGQAGSGLGLAIASRIVCDHRGEFGLESAVGRGPTGVPPASSQRH